MFYVMQFLMLEFQRTIHLVGIRAFQNLCVMSYSCDYTLLTSLR